MQAGSVGGFQCACMTCTSQWSMSKGQKVNVAVQEITQPRNSAKRFFPHRDHQAPMTTKLLEHIAATDDLKGYAVVRPVGQPADHTCQLRLE